MSMFSYKGLYHNINDKSEKIIYISFENVRINGELFRILDKEDWYMDVFKSVNGRYQIRFCSGYDYRTELKGETIQALLELSKKYPETVFCMEDSVDGYVAEWKNGVEIK